MNRNEFIEELKKILPSWLTLKVSDPRKVQKDIAAYCEYNPDEPVFCFVTGKKVPRGPGTAYIEFWYYEYTPADGTFRHTWLTSSDFDGALAHFKGVKGSINELKNTIDRCDLNGVNDTLQNLGFKRHSDYYTYNQGDLEVEIIPMHLGRMLIIPFQLILSRPGKKDLVEFFPDLDKLLEFIVEGGE